ncbi:MAG: hypothetical protein IT307_17370 [Chloroflexi bacterium]|nr:hypothetical protein [Chloroflexota bacterium]
MTNREQEHPHTGRRESRIPPFKTIRDEAEFWDTHDSADFEDEFEEVTDVRFVRGQRKKAITVRLEEGSLRRLRRQAAHQGIGPSTLVRMWVLERLRRGEE